MEWTKIREKGNAISRALEPYPSILTQNFPFVFRRNELFKISNIKGNYPQFFLEQMDGTTRYIGSWEYLQSLNEISSSLSSEIPRLRRCIESWETVFDDLVLSFNSEGDEKT